MQRQLRPTALALALLLTACGGTVDEPTTDDSSDVDLPADATEDAGEELPTDAGGQEPTGDPASGGSDPLLGPEIEVAMEDLVDRAGVEREQIQVLVTELVSWPDGSLGCPEPGTMYTQAIAEGYRLVLGVDGTEYAYHGAAGDDPVHCEDPQPPVVS